VESLPTRSLSCPLLLAHPSLGNTKSPPGAGAERGTQCSVLPSSFPLLLNTALVVPLLDQTCLVLTSLTEIPQAFGLSKFFKCSLLIFILAVHTCTRCFFVSFLTFHPTSCPISAHYHLLGPLIVTSFAFCPIISTVTPLLCPHLAFTAFGTTLSIISLLTKTSSWS